MSRRPARRSARAAAALAAALVVVAAGGCARAVDGTSPPCSERVQAEGRWPTVDPAGAVSIGWAHSEAHAEVRGLVEAVAEVERQRGEPPGAVPLDRRFWLPDGVGYVIVLTTLTDNPALATEPVLARLTDAARAGHDGVDGIAGLLELVRDDDALAAAGDDELDTLIRLVRARALRASEVWARELHDVCGDVPLPLT